MKKEITKRVSQVNENKVAFEVYGMDEICANIIFENAEFDNFEEALICFNAIELEEEGQQKFLVMIVVDEDNTIIAINDLLEFVK